MTDRHDPWGPDDDARVRAALMSLMDDVAAEPLPEPAFVRARAEDGGGSAPVVDLAARRRRRVLATVAGVAAAALVAVGVGVLVSDGTGTAPPASSGPAAPRPLTVLGADDWSAALGLDVTSTADTSQPAGQCFRVTDTDTTAWTRTVATLADDRVVGGQWIGTAGPGQDAPTGASDEAVTRCESTFTTTQKVTEDLPGGATYRAWHARGDDGTGVWWVEAARGPSASFISVAEIDGTTYTADDMRELARAALGDSGTSSGAPASTSQPAGTSTPTSSTPPPPPTTGTVQPQPPTATSTPTPAPSAPTDSPAPPTMPSGTAGPITDAQLLPAAVWGAPLVADSSSISTGDLRWDGAYDACLGDPGKVTRARAYQVNGGDGQPFARQLVVSEADAATADTRAQELVAAHESATCGDATTVTKIGSDVYRLQDEGGGVRWVTVTRMRSHSVSLVVLGGSALQPTLSDEDAAAQLRQVAEVAATL